MRDGSGSLRAHDRPRSARLALVAAMLWVAAPGCRYRVGTPPPGAGLAVGEIAAPVAEPGLPEALREALGAAIRRRGALGERAIQGQVERASFSPSAARDGCVQAWTATLGVRFVLLGPAPRELALTRALEVGTPCGTSEGLAVARAAAFSALAESAAEEAVDFFLWAPPADGGPRRGEP